MSSTTKSHGTTKFPTWIGRSSNSTHDIFMLRSASWMIFLDGLSSKGNCLAIFIGMRLKEVPRSASAPFSFQRSKDQWKHKRPSSLLCFSLCALDDSTYLLRH